MNVIFNAVSIEEFKRISNVEITHTACNILQTVHKGTKAIKINKLQWLNEPWEYESILPSTIKLFTDRVYHWNRTVFRNFFARKRTTLARLNGAQKALSNGPNHFLVQLEQDLIKEYSDIKLQEEEYWALKSCINWAAYGDRNTSFFHASTLVRRHRNKTRSIKNSQGNWVTEEEEVKNIILSGYKDLFETNILFSTHCFDIENFSCCFLSKGDMDFLYAPVTKEEIKNGLWALKPFKAPGVDGLHMGFFQYFWADVKSFGMPRGRRGLDNIIIAQELIHSLDNKKGKGGFMAIKVDLAKAYDCLKWSFIHKVLKAFHFPQMLIDLIMTCVSTTSISILFNGSKLDSFKPSRGIRQGDSLSPYLFIFCIEYLRSLIKKECIAKRWIPIKASRDNVEISHLFSVDDLMLFAKVSEKGSEAIKDVLDTFCEESW
ncbi:uncharacterized protein LOC136063082 [Quercus suber]|uniref:uncharacterized protein LOC136063082 n=1 Tax=Quercus suber TaxID=58331 RepID=UPI0032DF3953